MPDDANTTQYPSTNQLWQYNADESPPPVPPPLPPLPGLDVMNSEPTEPVGTPAATFQPPQVQQVSQQLDEVALQSKSAKQNTQVAVEQVRQLEQEAVQKQVELEKKVQQAKTQVDNAKRQIDQAAKTQEVGQQQVEEFTADAKSGFSIAGYKPGDLAQALVKPPEAAPNTPAAPPVDLKTQEELLQKAHKAQQTVHDTQAQVSVADERIAEALKVSQQAKKQQSSMVQKLSEVLDTLTGQQNNGSPNDSYKIFLLMGAGLMVLVLLMLILGKSMIVGLFLIAALIQFGMGGFLKKKSQG